jgi:ABC-type transport system substrate-binding protein
MNDTRRLVLGCVALVLVLLAGGLLDQAAAQTKPEGEMRWALYKQQARETDRKKREALLHQIQQIMNERVRIAPIFDYIWPSGIGPRVAELALMMINPYPWSAPLEDVRLKKS